jgi:predicted dehydrogenase
MRFLIAGLGSAGRRHLRNLLALGERDIVLYRTGRSTLPEDELAGFPVETSLEAALHRKPDAVIVANPTSLHLDVAIPAAKAGCHLLIEKPLAHSLEGVEELEAAVRKGVRILIGFQYRFHPGLEAIRRWVREGAVGPVLFARAHYGDYLPAWHPWEDYRSSYSARPELGGGAILTLCHPVDYLMWILGEPVVRWAEARLAPQLDIQVESVAEIGLDFPNGVLASIHLDFIQQPADHHVEVLSPEGTLNWNQADGCARLFRGGSRTAEEELGSNGFERDDMFLEEMRHFLAVVRGEAEPNCGLEMVSAVSPCCSRPRTSGSPQLGRGA